MVSVENAKLVHAEELKAFIDEEVSNPTVERLMFVEAQAAGGEGKTKIFPCYIEAWATDSRTNKDAVQKLMFQCSIVQSMGGEFGMLRVYIHEDELGVTKRIWDKPPTKGLRDETPWIATEVKQ